MAPILDTDVAAERWSKAEWENYELWEKIELRLRRQRRAWILATVILFVVLSAIPTVIDRWPKWMSRSAVRSLALEFNRIKREAIQDRTPYRLRFLEKDRLTFVVERLSSCESAEGEEVRTLSLSKSLADAGYSWIFPEDGQELGIPGLARDFCYDPLTGEGYFTKGKGMIGFGVASVKDLAEKRLDRISLLVLTGQAAEISFD